VIPALAAWLFAFARFFVFARLFVFARFFARLVNYLRIITALFNILPIITRRDNNSKNTKADKFWFFVKTYPLSMKKLL
jgi:hypothetical protein